MRKGQIRTQKLYKWYEDDIWGILCLKKKPSRALRHLYKTFKYDFSKRKFINKKKYFSFKKRFRLFYKERFVYQINAKDEEFKRRRRNFKVKLFFNMIKLRLYYGKVKLRPFRGILNKNNNNKRLSPAATPLSLEGRLGVLLYRTNLFSSIFLVKRLLKLNVIFVNGVCISESKFTVNTGDIITISPEIYPLVFEIFFLNLKKNRILVNYPKYIEIDYRIGSFVLIHAPKWNEVYYPFEASIQSTLFKY